MQCSVCLQKINQQQQYKLQNCIHKFHQKCIADWIFITENCPLCKKQLNQTQIKKLLKNIPQQKKIEKNTNKAFEILNSDDNYDEQKINDLIKNNPINLYKTDNQGLFLIDYAIMWTNYELFEILLQKGHDIYRKNGDNKNTIDVINKIIKNVNQDIMTKNIIDKIKQKIDFNDEELEHLHNLAILEKIKNQIKKHGNPTLQYINIFKYKSPYFIK
jgi:hypothetical protein